MGINRGVGGNITQNYMYKNASGSIDPCEHITCQGQYITFFGRTERHGVMDH